MSTNILAGLFRWLRTVIEEADRPLSLLITILLPFIAPVIPSIITAKNLVKYMDYDATTAMVAAIAFGLVGYVSMVMAIGAIMNFVEQEHNNRVWLPVLVSTGSYMVYVVALVLVNVILEYNHGVEGTKIAVTALMTLGLELPSAGLNGMRVSTRSIKEEQVKREEREWAHQEKLRKEEQEFKLRKLSVKSQTHKISQEILAPSRELLKTSYSVSPLEEKIFSLLDNAYKKEKRILAGHELVKRGFDKTTAFRYRLKWLRQNNLIDK